MRSMAVRIHHVGLESAAGVPGLTAAAGLRPVEGLDLGDGSAELLAGPNLFVERRAVASAELSAPRAVNAPGIAHLCLQARDGDGARAALEATGTDFLSEPVALGTGFLYAYARDAEGRLLELESAPFLPAEPPAWFGHLAYVSRDAGRLAGFYGALVGAPVAAGGRFRDNPLLDRVAALPGVDVEVWWVRSEPIGLEFWKYRAPEAGSGGRGIGRYTHLGVETDDLEAALVRAEREGGTRDGGITAGTDGRAGWARDPDGNRIRLIELAAPGLATAALPHFGALAAAARSR